MQSLRRIRDVTVEQATMTSRYINFDEVSASLVVNSYTQMSGCARGTLRRKWNIVRLTSVPLFRRGDYELLRLPVIFFQLNGTSPRIH